MPNSKPLLIGIDLGSSGVKATLLHAEQAILASATHEVSQFSEHQGWSEADPAQWWSASCSAIRELLTTPGVLASHVGAVAVSGMVPAVVVVDENNQPLRRGILQNDARATKEIGELRERLAHVDLLSLVGSVLSQQSVAPTALWLARNEPAVWSSTSALMGSYDWLSVQLGAQRHVEYNWALESGLYRISMEPLSDVYDATAVTWPKALPVRYPGDVVGEVSTHAAEATGLVAGTTIVVGGADHVLSAYGAGLTKEGDCLVKLGGAGDILAVRDDVHLDPRLYLDAHPIPGKWLPNGCMATSGSLLRWEQSLLGGADLETLDAEASQSAPGALVALPYFLGEKTPLHDPDLRGVIAGLHLASTRGDIHRSFLEAIAYGFRSHFDVFSSGGLDITHTTVTNGGSKSRLWREILADVLGRDLHSIINHPGASYGAAVIAGIGAGVIDDWSYVVGHLEEGETISPNPENVTRYNERYADYVALTSATTEISHRLARSL